MTSIGRRLAEGAQHALLHLLAVRHACGTWCASSACCAARPRASPTTSIEGKPDTVKAETCDKCRRYVKILYQVNDPALEPWPTTSPRSASTCCWPRRAGSAAARTRSCWATEHGGPHERDASHRPAQAPLRRPGAAHATSARVAVARFGHEATVDAIRRTLGAAARGRARRAAPPSRMPTPSRPRRCSLLEQRGCAEPAPRVQSHRHGAAHQPRPRRPAGERDRRGRRRHALAGGARVRHRRRRRAASATTTCAASIRELTGAEDACVVNNNAAAVLLVLNTLRRRQGGDRLARRADRDRRRVPPARHHGARRRAPVEVGTTNRTHLQGLRAGASAPSTGLILKAHTSNYLIQGFTKSVPAPELAALARARKVPFVARPGLRRAGRSRALRPRAEPTVRECAGRGRRPRHLLRRQAAGRPAGRHHRRRARTSWRASPRTR